MRGYSGRGDCAIRGGFMEQREELSLNIQREVFQDVTLGDAPVWS